MKTEEIGPLMEEIEKEAILRSKDHIKGDCLERFKGDHTICREAWALMLAATQQASG